MLQGQEYVDDLMRSCPFWNERLSTVQWNLRVNERKKGILSVVTVLFVVKIFLANRLLRLKVYARNGFVPFIFELRESLFIC